MPEEVVDVDPEVIREALEAGKASIGSLAEAAGVVPATLWAWAAGRRRPRRENLRALADALEERGGRLQEIAAALREASEDS